MTHAVGLLKRYCGFESIRRSLKQAADAWHMFWFRPADPLMLGIIRLLCGWMLLYNLLVWTLDLEAFFSDHGLQPLEAVRGIYADRHIFSFWLWTGDAWLWPMHFACMGIAGMFCLGIATRVTSILCFLITISYSQRVPIANFGFDQILGMLCLYLSVGPSGAAVSVDALQRRWWLRRRGVIESVRKFPSARVAMRLIQLHLCAIYFWAGFAKLKGPSWWTGQAIWNVIANQEYQTLDLTWMAKVPWLPFLVAHVTIAWEIFFIVLVWNPRFRPLMLAMGVAMHIGIGAFLGMWTFGLIMAFAYLAFSDPDVWRSRINRFMQWYRSEPGNDEPDNLSLRVLELPVAENHSAAILLRPTIAFSEQSSQFPVLNVTEHTSLTISGEQTLKDLCVVAAAADDRATLRRYFRDHHIPCRAVPDLASGLDILSRYQVSAVIINTTQFPPTEIVNFVSDVSDLTSLPTLVLLTPQHLGAVTELREIDGADWLELPASLREIRTRLQSLKYRGTR